MKRIILITTVCACGLLPLQAQSVDEVLQSVAQHNKSIQAQQKNGEAEKIGIEAENSLEDPTVEYSSFFSKGVNGQSGSELVVSQGFDFPTCRTRQERSRRLPCRSLAPQRAARSQNPLPGHDTAEPAKRPAGQTHAKCRRAVGLV